ncbi:AP2 domain-containing protein [bacterium]|nr:AP2 domain-containing protein [bacterium]
MGTADQNYALARIDLPGASTHGWQVRLQRRGVKFAKYFGDRVYGDHRRSLTAARQWRDELLTKIEASEQARICTRSARNRSGVVGVSRVTVVTNGSTYEFWQATWSPEVGRRRCVKFSIRRYGDNEAFRLAVIAREEAVGEKKSP